MRAVRVGCAVVMAAALVAAGCGGGEGADAAASSAGADVDDPAPWLSGIPADTPAEATACLEDAGLTVRVSEPPPEDAGRGAVRRLEATGADGAAIITWFASEEEAFRAHSQALDDQERGTTVGRTGEALYVAPGEDWRSVVGCL